MCRPGLVRRRTVYGAPIAGEERFMQTMPCGAIPVQPSASKPKLHRVHGDSVRLRRANDRNPRSDCGPTLRALPRRPVATGYQPYLSNMPCDDYPNNLGNEHRDNIGDNLSDHDYYAVDDRDDHYRNVVPDIDGHKHRHELGHHDLADNTHHNTRIHHCATGVHAGRGPSHRLR